MATAKHANLSPIFILIWTLSGGHWLFCTMSIAKRSRFSDRLLMCCLAKRLFLKMDEELAILFGWAA